MTIRLSSQAAGRVAVAWIALGALALASGAAASPASFNASFPGGPETAMTDPYEIEGTVYVSLLDLVEQFGGGARVSPGRVQVDIQGRRALANLQDTLVDGADERFRLRNPVLRRDDDVFIAMRDIEAFFNRGFGVSVTIFDEGAPRALAGQQPAVAVDELEGPQPIAPMPGDDPEAAPPLVAPEPEPELEPEPEPELEPEPEPSAPAPSRSGEARRIVIDPGHGGNDSGHAGPGGLLEKDVTLAIGRLLAEALDEHDGFSAVLTRTDDRELSIQARANLANQHQGDVLISLHAGAAFSERAHGVEIFYPSRSGQETRAAAGRRTGPLAAGAAVPRELAASIAGALESTPVARRVAIHEAPLRLFRQATMPGVLIELGYLSNPGDEALLVDDDIRAAIARGVARGIVAALEQGARR